MKLTKLFSKLWLSAAALLAFSACSNEDLPTQTASEAPKTKQIKVTFTAGQEEGLRAVYGLKPDETGAISGLQMSDKNVLIRLSTWAEGGTDYVIQDIEFTKAANQNYATYSGVITVPAGGTGKYKVAALLLAEVGGEKFCSYPTLSGPQVVKSLDATYTPSIPSVTQVVVSSSTAETVKINVPYATAWQDITAVGGEAEPITLRFSPQGTLLRMRIQNESANQKTFARIKFVTNAFVRSGGFQIAEQRDNQPAFYASNMETAVYSIPKGITLAGKSGNTKVYSPWMYVWLMPRKTRLDLHTIASVSTNTTGVQDSYKIAFTTKQYLPLGSVPVTLTYTDGHDMIVEDFTDHTQEWGSQTPAVKTPLSYVASYALDNTGKAFVTDHEYNNASIGFFDQQQITTDLTTVRTINGIKYSAPTRNELASIFPPEHDITGYGTQRLTYIGQYTYDVAEANIKIGDLTQNYKADYYKSKEVLYAIRLKNSTNQYRTAFRYRIETSGSGSKSFVVETIHIGTELVELSDIINDTFWTDRAADIESRKFPLYGTGLIATRNAPFIQQNETCYYGSSSIFDSAAIYTADLYGGANNNVWCRVTQSRLDRIYPVVPFVRD